MKIRHFLTGLVLLGFAAALHAAEHMPSPAAVGQQVAANLLARNYMMYGEDGLHYAEAAAAVGALRFAAATEDDELRDRLIMRYQELLSDESPLVSRREHVDMSVIGAVPLQVAILTKDPAYLAQGQSFADRQWDEPLESGLTNQTRWWIDDLYMVGMLQIQAYRATGDPKYADRAAFQLEAYLKELQHDNGLFYHAPDVPIFWGRGNGWVAVAMAEVLSSLPENHRLYGQLTWHYLQMMRSLLHYQGEDGMWRQVVDNESAWPESSGTAMFAYAMQLGIDKHVLAQKQYAPAVLRAWAALITRLDADGNLDAVCVGTGKKNDLQYYFDRPTVNGDLHGQAPLLWLATALVD